MPLTVFQVKGIPGHRRERIESAVVAGGRHVLAPHEAWIVLDPRGVCAYLLLSSRASSGQVVSRGIKGVGEPKDSPRELQSWFDTRTHLINAAAGLDSNQDAACPRNCPHTARTEPQVA